MNQVPMPIRLTEPEGGSPDIGARRIASAFAALKTENRAALIPYVTLGFPTPDASLALAEAAVSAGADLLELGVPFSDPLADGPVIQRAAHIALQNGITVGRCLELVRDLRMRGIMVPFIFMGYYNPILAYGERAFCSACREAQVDGLIVPDLPPEEGEALERECRTMGLAMIYLLAPTSTPERIRFVTERSSGFVYLVSVTGTTGARERLPADLGSFVARVRDVTDKPLAVGFGISSPDQARQVARQADGVVVGSALLRRVEASDGIEKARAFVAELHGAMALNSTS
jgi:tryptophan synthase alpha chain